MTPANGRSHQSFMDRLALLLGGSIEQRFSSISDTVLLRSPHYPQWCSEVEKVFARIDDGIDMCALSEVSLPAAARRAEHRGPPPRGR